MSLPVYSHDDAILIRFFGQLLRISSDNSKHTTAYELCEIIYRELKVAQFRDGSAHQKVVRQFWVPFSSQLLEFPQSYRPTFEKGDRFRILVERYVTHSLWYAYWNYNENVKPFSDWKGIRHMFLQEATGILKERSKEKLEIMKAIRDRFLVQCHAIRANDSGAWFVLTILHSHSL
jgi:hypothetical protein